MNDDYPLHRAVMLVEAQQWTRPARKLQHIQDTLGLGDVAYHQLVNRIIDSPSPDIAREFGPVVNRLRRLRELRRAQRTARRAS